MLEFMEKKKLFYVTNSEPPQNEPAWSLALQKLQFEETSYYITGETARWEEILEKEGISFKLLKGKSPSHTGIIGKAQEEKASLITANLASGGAGISRRKVLRNLIRFTQVPFLLLPTEEEASSANISEKGIFDHVIFATDWYPFSQKCLDVLLKFKDNIVELEILTVINKKLSIRDMIGLKDMIEETRELLLNQGIDAEGHVYAGKPSEEILLAVKDYDGTVIVMETSHRSALKTFFYGNCTYEVAEKASVPILIVP
jgi:nucleotide-binding universal stress UspA family protein